MSSTVRLPPRTQLCVRYCSNKQQQPRSRTSTRIAAQRKINRYRQQDADNHNISFLTAIVSTSTRTHGEFLRLRFLQADQETESHLIATGMLSQRNHSDMFRFRRAAFYQSLKRIVGIAAKAAALRINLNVDSRSVAG
jgi:hypothetical protein